MLPSTNLCFAGPKTLNVSSVRTSRHGLRDRTRRATDCSQQSVRQAPSPSMSRKLSRRIIGQVLLCPPRAGSAYRVKGRPKPGASGPLTRRRPRYAGEGWRAALASMQGWFWSHIYRRQHLLQSDLRPWSEAGHRARETPGSHRLLSAGKEPASSCMRVTPESLSGSMPHLRKSVASATRAGDGHVHFKR
jgi:hypothetical protein